jgi:Lon protease-like protein
MNLSPVVPVMLLQQCNLFPNGLLPLYVFEPRYRAMLRHALEHDRMLCIGTLSPCDEDQAVESDDRISEYSTAAVIRACVANEDGTSQLILQGTQRVRFLSWEQYEPFRIARIEPLETTCPDPASAALKSEELLQRVLARLSPGTDTGRQIEAQLHKLRDPALLTDFVAGNLIHDSDLRQPLLGMTNVEERLDYLLHLLPGAPLVKPS